MRINCISILAPIVVVAVIVVIGSLCIVPAYVQESKGAQRQIQHEVIPLDADLDNLECGGELVHAQGEIHIFSYIVQLDDGGLRIRIVIDWRDVEGVGLESGDIYRVINSFNSWFSSEADGSFLNIEKTAFGFLKGPDKGDDLTVRAIFRFKFDASGQVAVEDSEVRVMCGHPRL